MTEVKRRKQSEKIICLNYGEEGHIVRRSDQHHNQVGPCEEDFHGHSRLSAQTAHVGERFNAKLSYFTCGI